MLELSEKLKAYIEKIEKETGLSVLIQKVQDIGLPGMDAGFKLDPKYIRVEIIQKDIPKEQIEQSIAHETTHGFLAYKKKYCQLKFVRICDKVEEMSVGILCTMIEDIVVNKTIHRNNFRPYAYSYIDTVQAETKSARKGKDCYQQFNKDPIFKDRFMIFRYIMAWSFLKYFNLDAYDRRIISKFVKRFQKSYPKKYEEARQVEEIILENNIFTSEGYYNIIKRCLELWNLADLVQLVTE